MRRSRNRRVRVGLDDMGRSVVVSDGHDMACVEPPTGVSIQEVWWQESVPAREGDDGSRPEPLGLAPPTAGGVVRLLSVPPSGDGWKLDLHYDDSMHVITLVAGELDVVLEVGVVTLQPLDTIVLPASVHDLRNRTDEEATFVYTSFPLQK